MTNDEGDTAGAGGTSADCGSSWISDVGAIGTFLSVIRHSSFPRSGVRRQDPLDHGGPGEAGGDVAATSAAVGGTARGVGEEGIDRGGEGDGVLGRDEEAGFLVAHDLAEASEVGGD